MNKLCFLSNLTSSEWAAWVQAVGSIAAIAAGFAIAFYQMASARREGTEARNERLRACWAAVRAEVETCGEQAQAYFNPPVVMAPSYRWPTVVGKNILHELLLLAKMNKNEVGALLLFYSNVDAVNRGFDIAQQINTFVMDETERKQRLNNQFTVNASRIEKHLGPGGDYYDAAVEVIRRHTTNDR